MFVSLDFDPGKLEDLSDEALITSLRETCMGSRRLLARLLVHLAEVEQRSLHLVAAVPSMFEFCTRRLAMSEGEAYRRITCARLSRKYPSILVRIEEGRIHLSAIMLIREHLTAENAEELFDLVSGKSKREIEELLARRAPRPDAKPTVTKLPLLSQVDWPEANGRPITLRPPETNPPLGRIEPLAEDRFRIQLTASRAIRAKLDRALDLMRHRNPSGDLEVLLDHALDALLAQLAKERTGKTERASAERKPSSGKSGRITQATRREVFERDGEQCTFVDADGNRCPATMLLEIDHIDSKGLGGSDAASNLRVLCRPHNLHHAQQVYSKSHVAKEIQRRRDKKQAAAAAVAAPSSFELARRGLLNLGFRDAEARHALEKAASSTEPNAPTSAADLIRAALATLNDARSTIHLRQRK